jgi:hypothetical protein
MYEMKLCVELLVRSSSLLIGCHFEVMMFKSLVDL